MVASPKVSSNVLLDRFFATKDITIRNEIVMQYDNLVKKIAAKFIRNTEPFDDLWSEGIYGLIKAIEGYQPGLNANFYSYAKKKIQSEIKHYLRSANYILSVPCHITEKDNKLWKIEEEMTAKLERQVTTFDIISSTDMTEHDVDRAQKARLTRFQSDFQASSDDYEGNVEIDPSSKKDDIDRFLLIESLRMAFSQMDSQSRKIIKLRHLYGFTITELKSAMKMGNKKVCESLALAEKKLYCLLEDAPRYLSKNHTDQDTNFALFFRRQLDSTTVQLSLIELQIFMLTMTLQRSRPRRCGDYRLIADYLGITIHSVTSAMKRLQHKRVLQVNEDKESYRIVRSKFEISSRKSHTLKLFGIEIVGGNIYQLEVLLDKITIDIALEPTISKSGRPRNDSLRIISLGENELKVGIAIVAEITNGGWKKSSYRHIMSAIQISSQQYRSGIYELTKKGVLEVKKTDGAYYILKNKVITPRLMKRKIVEPFPGILLRCGSSYDLEKLALILMQVQKRGYQKVKAWSQQKETQYGRTYCKTITEACPIEKLGRTEMIVALEAIKLSRDGFIRSGLGRLIVKNTGLTKWAVESAVVRLIKKGILVKSYNLGCRGYTFEKHKIVFDCKTGEVNIEGKITLKPHHIYDLNLLAKRLMT